MMPAHETTATNAEPQSSTTHSNHDTTHATATTATTAEPQASTTQSNHDTTHATATTAEPQANSESVIFRYSSWSG